MTSPASFRLIPSREARQIAERAIELGWTLRRTKRHYALCSPERQHVVFSGTPTDRRALLNLRAQLRRYGCAI